MWRLGMMATVAVAAMTVSCDATGGAVRDQVSHDDSGAQSNLILSNAGGQSFMVGIAGQLDSIQLTVFNLDPPTRLVATLFHGEASDGRPIGDPIAEVETPLETVPRPGRSLTIGFSDAQIDAEVGDRLFVGFDSGTARHNSGIRSSWGNVYADGDMYTFENGGWGASPSNDLQFETFMIPYAKRDMNHDHYVNGLDVDPFVYAVLNEPFNLDADVNEDGAVTGLDIEPFVAALLSEGNGLQQIPEPSAMMLCVIAVGAVAGLRRFR